MGKKGKGTKKEDKPKKEVLQTTAAKNKALQEALEGVNVTVSPPTPRNPPPPPPRTSSSKKSDRGGNALTKIGCTESFRWDNSEKAPVLPPMEETRKRGASITSVIGGHPFFFRQPRQQDQPFSVQLHSALNGGWRSYFNWRCNGDDALVESASKSKTLKDGLSGPLTIANLIIQWMIKSPQEKARRRAPDPLETDEPLHIVVIGATAVYEEKLLRESDYWDELLAIFSRRKVRLYLTGPEMSGKDGQFKRKNPGAEDREQRKEDGSHVECWKTTAVDFFLKKGRLELFQKEDTVVVGLNCGFGVAARRMLNTAAAKQDLASNQVLWSWIPTLHFIAALELPLMVTACDYQDAFFTRMVLQFAVGMYNVQEIAISQTPFESSISQPAPEKEVKANAYLTIVQGQQRGFNFATQAPQGGDKDTRVEELRKIASLSQTLSTKKWNSPERLQQGSRLVPLKRYGNYPPEDRELRTHDDDSESEIDVPKREGRGKETEGVLPPAALELKYSVVDEGPSSLKIVVEDVFMADPATARLGMRKGGFALHYFDCQTLRDVVFEAALPKEVDHTTTKTTFKRSAASMTIVVGLLETKK
eukprot:g2605.t1